MDVHPQSPLWQSPAWKTYQEALGREVRSYSNGGASALVIIDRTAFGLSTWDIPRGPVWENGKEADAVTLLTQITADASAKKAIALFFSPTGTLRNVPQRTRRSVRHEQPEATRIVDLSQEEDAILAQMKTKGRYNIRVAEKHGITVRESDDLDIFYALMTETKERDRFSILPQGHYRKFLDLLPGSFLLLAYKGTKPIAGLMGVLWEKQGIYYYGASSYEERALMAPYLLQWEAMRRCKNKGCLSYDLLGVSPADAEEDHPWRGITAFKEKFGGALHAYPAEQMIVLRPFAYWMLRCKRRIFG